MRNDLPFEQTLTELRGKIEDLRSFSTDKKMDFQHEISVLEERFDTLKDEIYNNLTAAQKMQIARHPGRPTTLDYIRHMFTDFSKCKGTDCLEMTRPL